MKIAIAIFLFNRPEKAAGMIKSLCKCEFIRDFPIYCFIDGPRNELESILVDKTLKIAEEVFFNYGIDNVIFRKRKFNIGLRNSIINGTTEISKSFDAFIVFEDDLNIHPYALKYFSSSLEKYKNNNKVYQISGFNNFNPVFYKNKIDNFFCKRVHSWGWATWSDKWNSVSWELEYYRELLNSSSFKSNLTFAGSDLYQMLKDAVDNKTSSWAVLFAAHVINNDGLVSYPKNSLINNVGFGKDATNCSNKKFNYVKMEDYNRKGDYYYSDMVNESVWSSIFLLQYSLLGRAFIKIVSIFKVL